MNKLEPEMEGSAIRSLPRWLPIPLALMMIISAIFIDEDLRSSLFTVLLVIFFMSALFYMFIDVKKNFKFYLVFFGLYGLHALFIFAAGPFFPVSILIILPLGTLDFFLMALLLNWVTQ